MTNDELKDFIEQERSVVIDIERIRDYHSITLGIAESEAYRRNIGVLAKVGGLLYIGTSTQRLGRVRPGASSTSNFASLISSGSGATFSFTNGILTVVQVGPSAPAHLTGSYSGGVLSLSWPSGQGWRLQMQTNSLSVGISTNWSYITDGSVSSTNITVDPSKPSVFYRLKYP